jgi:leucyl-tRNA synthetase
VLKMGFKLVDSDFLNGLGYKEGTYKCDFELEKLNQGSEKSLPFARCCFSRQRYWENLSSVLCKWLATND